MRRETQHARASIGGPGTLRGGPLCRSAAASVECVAAKRPRRPAPSRRGLWNSPEGISKVATDCGSRSSLVRASALFFSHDFAPARSAPFVGTFERTQRPPNQWAQRPSSAWRPRVAETGADRVSYSRAIELAFCSPFFSEDGSGAHCCFWGWTTQALKATVPRPWRAHCPRVRCGRRSWA